MRSLVWSPTIPFKNFFSLHSLRMKFSNLTFPFEQHTFAPEKCLKSRFCDCEAWFDEIDTVRPDSMKLTCRFWATRAHSYLVATCACKTMECCPACCSGLWRAVLPTWVRQPIIRARQTFPSPLTSSQCSTGSVSSQEEDLDRCILCGASPTSCNDRFASCILCGTGQGLTQTMVTVEPNSKWSVQG